LTFLEKEYIFTMLNCPTESLRLLYRASKDGYSSNDFHSRSDDLAKTVVIIHNSNDFVIGGYTEATWTWNGEACKNDSNAFIFNLRRGGVSNYLKIPTRDESCSIRAIPDYGPIFGFDDILVDFKVRNLSGNFYDGWCSFGSIYRCPPIDTCETTAAFLCGDWGYFFGDVEVFKFYN
jgi:hypothetical protein